MKVLVQVAKVTIHIDAKEITSGLKKVALFHFFYQHLPQCSPLQWFSPSPWKVMEGFIFKYSSAEKQRKGKLRNSVKAEEPEQGDGEATQLWAV